MTNTQPQLAPENADQDSTWSSASKLSRKVRKLAHRSHHALKARALSEQGAHQIGDDLGDLRRQIERLHRKIHERRLGVLVPWVDALKRQVEEQLGNEGKRAPR